MVPTRPSLARRNFLLSGIALACLPMQAWSQGETPPEDVVQALIDAMAENDPQGITAVFADNARQAYGTRTPRTGDAFRAWLQSDIVEDQGRLADAILTTDGNSVVATGTYRNANGYESAADFLFIVEDGRIASWTIR